MVAFADLDRTHLQMRVDDTASFALSVELHLNA